MNIIEKYLNEKGLIGHQIDTFNDFILNGIQTVINDEPNIYTTNNKEVVFSNVRFERPFYVVNNEKKKITPYISREKSLTYEFSVKVDLEYDGEKHLITLCTLPAMVRSIVCNLYEKTEEERVALREIVGDFGGYFIINGKERIITGQTRKTYNRFICFKNLEQEFICEIRSSCEETAKSSLIQVKFNNKKTNVEMVMDNLTVGVGDIFIALGVVDIDSLIGTDEIFLEEMIYFIKKNISGSDPSIDVSQLFPHLGQCPYFLKAVFLGKMVRKLCLAECKVIQEEEKSNLAYKRVDMVGVLCKDLFKMLWKQFIKSLTKEIEKRKIGSILPIVNIKKKNISLNFYYCFSTGVWGIKKNSYKKMGVSEFAQNKVSALTNLALLRKFNIPIGKKDKNTKIRQMHPSSIFYICPFETPEGSSVGTRLTLATLSFVSVSTPFIILKEMLARLNIMIDIDKFTNVESLFKNFVYTVLLNGSIVGITDDIKKFFSVFNAERDRGIIKSDVSIYRDENLNTIEIWCDSSRFMRPLLKTSKLFLLTPNMDIKTMENKGILVYRDPAELEYSYVSMDYNNLYADYTEIHPSCIMGIVAAQIVFSNHTQSPRVCYMSNMIKQAVGILPTHEVRSDSTIYSLENVQRPLNTTKIADIIGLNEYPNGINAIVAVACYTGFNQEDSIIVNKGSIDRGLFKTIIKKTISTETKSFASFEEIVCIPDSKYRLSRDYSKLDENGVVKIGSTVYKGDVIIGKILKTKHADFLKIEDKSIIVKSTEEGIVDDVQIHSSIVKVIISQTKIPEIGDKLCSGMAQKGTIGMILPEVDMPFTSSGMVPDLIINPHCLPSRMTINQFMSCICAKARCVSGKKKYSDGSPFQGTELLDDAGSELEFHDFSSDGTEELFNGMTGEKMEARIFIGLVFYHRLVHLASFKMFASTNTNIKNKLTRQPLNGRSNDGGLRIGEMEKDCLLRHGTIKFAGERLMDLSDKYIFKLCNICNDYNHVSKINNGFICNKCKTIDVSTVSAPYATKLLVQELESMGLNVTMTA